MSPRLRGQMSSATHLDSRAHVHLCIVLAVILIFLSVLPVCFLRRHRRRGRSRVGFTLGICTRMIVHNNGVIHFSRTPRRGTELLLRHVVRVSESVVNDLRFLFATENVLLLHEELSGRCLLKTKALKNAAVFGLWK